MTELVTAEALTMSSREIAKLTGKRHDHVLRDIRAYVGAVLQMERGIEVRSLDWTGAGGVQVFGEAPIGGVTCAFETNPQNRQKYPVYYLDHSATLTVVSGYNVLLRKRIIDRWMELEAEAQSRATTSRTAPGRDLPPSGEETHTASPHVFDSYLTRYFDQMQEKVVAPLVQIVADLVHKVDAPGNVRSVGISESPAGRETLAVDASKFAHILRALHLDPSKTGRIRPAPCPAGSRIGPQAGT